MCSIEEGVVKLNGELIQKPPKDNENHKFRIKNLLERHFDSFKNQEIRRIVPPSSGFKRVNEGTLMKTMAQK